MQFIHCLLKYYIFTFVFTYFQQQQQHRSKIVLVAVVIFALLLADETVVARPQPINALGLLSIHPLTVMSFNVYIFVSINSSLSSHSFLTADGHKRSSVQQVGKSAGSAADLFASLAPVPSSGSLQGMSVSSTSIIGGSNAYSENNLFGGGGLVGGAIGSGSSGFGFGR